MGLLEQQRINELREQIQMYRKENKHLRNEINNIRLRIDKIEGKNINYVYNDKRSDDAEPLQENKIAVYAPEPWMKEKVAKVWNVNPNALYGEEIPMNYPYIFKDEYNKYNNCLNAHDSKCNAEDDGLTVVSFQDFCKQHGEPDRPDYVKSLSIIYRVISFGSNNEAITHINEFGNTAWISQRDWQPATEKEYLEQEENFPDTWDKVYEEPELKLNKEWFRKYSGGVVQCTYLEGAKNMQKAVYDRALEVYDISYDYNLSQDENWEHAQNVVFDEMINGTLKPPKQ